MQIFEKVDFQRKTFFQVALENFSDVVWRCSRYLKVSPNIALRVREKITTIQHVHKKIIKKTQNLGPKKTSLQTTVDHFGKWIFWCEIGSWEIGQTAHVRHVEGEEKYERCNAMPRHVMKPCHIGWRIVIAKFMTKEQDYLNATI